MQTIITWKRGKEEAAEEAEEDAVEAQVRVLVLVQDLDLDLDLVLVLAHVQDQDQAQAQAQAQVQAQVVQVVHQAAAPGTQGKHDDLDHSRCFANQNSSDTSSASPSYGGGKYFGGGATSAYRAGGRSPGANIAPLYFLAAASIFPGVWLYGAYQYNYDHPYHYHNRTSNSNDTLPVTCLCEKYSACGCDDNNNSTYLDTILGDGTPGSQNSSLVHVGDVNGTKTIVLNGTLPNGTDTTGNDTDTTSSASHASKRLLLEMSGFWVVGALVGAT
ncbi:hypothetical protein MMC29_008251, partial [Sticta canariensis]|nr:hypothetical protein [Sticta canariensis]